MDLIYYRRLFILLSIFFLMKGTQLLASPNEEDPRNAKRTLTINVESKGKEKAVDGEEGEENKDSSSSPLEHETKIDHSSDDSQALGERKGECEKTIEESGSTSKSSRPRTLQYWTDYLPPEVSERLFSFLCKGGHPTLKAYMNSKMGQGDEFDKIRRIYELATPNNLQYSIAPQIIINYLLKRPLVFNFNETFIETQLMRVDQEDERGYRITPEDLTSLTNIFLDINQIDEICFDLVSATHADLFQVKSFLEGVKESNIRCLNFTDFGLLNTDESRKRQIYFVKNLWPVIKGIPLLRALDFYMEDADRLKFIIKDITFLNLPLEFLAIGYVKVKDQLADSIALLIANSSFLKKLEMHDISTDLESFKSIFISAQRKKSFLECKISDRGNGSYFGEDGEDEEAILELSKGSPKFE